MKKEKIFQEEKKVMKKKIIAAFLTTAMTIGSLSGVTVFAADAGTDEKVEMADAGIPWVVSMVRRSIHW